MSRRLLMDTGPLVAILNCRSQYYDWAEKIWQNSLPPAVTVEPVLSEAAFILDRDGLPIDPLFELLTCGSLKIGLHVEDHIQDIRILMKRYENRPVSLADACLIRLSELTPDASVVTFDSDFKIYRKHGNKVIPTLFPG